MPSLQCLELSPIGKCGSHGECFTLPDNATGEFCACENGWVQSTEMSLFFMTRDEFNEGISICHQHEGLVKLLYSLIFISAVFSLLYQCSFITNKKQLKRIIPFICGLLLQIVFPIYKFANFDTVNFGDDVGFSFMIGNAALFDWIAITVFNNRYLKYLSQEIPMTRVSSTQTFKFFKDSAAYFAVVDFILYQFFWIPTLLPDQDFVVKEKMIRTAFGLILCRVIFYLVVTYLMFTQFLNDIKLIVNMEYNVNKRATPTIVPNPGQAPNQASEKGQLRDHLKNHVLPTTILLKRLTLSLAMIYIFFLLICTAWPLALLNWGYMHPVIFIAWCITNFIAIRANVKVAHAKRRLRRLSGIMTLRSSLGMIKEITKGSNGRNSSKDETHVKSQGSQGTSAVMEMVVSTEEA